MMQGSGRGRKKSTGGPDGSGQQYGEMNGNNGTGPAPAGYGIQYDAFMPGFERGGGGSVNGNQGQDDEPSYVCRVCGKSFTRPNNLKSHMLSHSADKPYACRYCDQAFVRAYDQRRHERGHTTESKAFTCEYCGKGFTRHDALSRHQGLIKSSAPVCSMIGKTGAPPPQRPTGRGSKSKSADQKASSAPPPAHRQMQPPKMPNNSDMSYRPDFQRDQTPTGPSVSYDGYPVPYGGDPHMASGGGYFPNQGQMPGQMPPFPMPFQQPPQQPNQMDPPAHAFYGPPQQSYRQDWAYGPYGYPGPNSQMQPGQQGFYNDRIPSPGPLPPQNPGFRNTYYAPPPQMRQPMSHPVSGGAEGEVYGNGYGGGPRGEQLWRHSPYPTEPQSFPLDIPSNMTAPADAGEGQYFLGSMGQNRSAGGAERGQYYVPPPEIRRPTVAEPPQQQVDRSIPGFGPPSLLSASVRLVSESLDPTVPVLHWPTFIARAQAGKADMLLRDTVTWTAANIALRKVDPLLGEMDRVWGPARVAGLEERVLQSIQSRFGVWDTAGRRPPMDDVERKDLVAFLQSVTLAIVAQSRAGRTDRARALLLFAIPVHNALQFDAEGSIARATFRRGADGMPLGMWIRAEEEARVGLALVAVETAIAALDDTRPLLRLEDMPNVAVPCPDTAFANIPGAVERDWTLDPAMMVRLGVEWADAQERVGTIIDRLQGNNQWSTERRDPFSLAESILWVTYPRGTPERQNAAQLAVGGFLSNGQQSASLQMIIINSKIRNLRRWFAYKGLAIHKPGEWDQSLDLSVDGDAVPVEVAREAEMRRAECDAMLKEFWSFIPMVLKGLDSAADGVGLVEVGEERWGKISGHRLLHWFLWYHAGEIMLNSPRNWLHTLRYPDPNWTSSPGFLHANAHAIGISRLIRSVVPLYSGNVWLQTERFPASILLPLLSAGMVHVHYLSQFRKHAEAGSASAAVIRELVVDIQACLQSLAHNVVYWENARTAYSVFLKLADASEEDWAQEAGQLKSLKGIGHILDPEMSSSSVDSRGPST